MDDAETPARTPLERATVAKEQLHILETRHYQKPYSNDERSKRIAHAVRQLAVELGDNAPSLQSMDNYAYALHKGAEQDSALRKIMDEHQTALSLASSGVRFMEFITPLLNALEKHAALSDEARMDKLMTQAGAQTITREADSTLEVLMKEHPTNMTPMLEAHVLIAAMNLERLLPSEKVEITGMDVEEPTMQLQLRLSPGIARYMEKLLSANTATREGAQAVLAEIADKKLEKVTKAAETFLHAVVVPEFGKPDANWLQKYEDEARGEKLAR